jgi:hypothetical protein
MRRGVSTAGKASGPNFHWGHMSPQAYANERVDARFSKE